MWNGIRKVLNRLDAFSVKIQKNHGYGWCPDLKSRFGSGWHGPNAGLCYKEQIKK